MFRQLYSKISTHSFTGVGVDDVLAELSGWLAPPGAQDELERRALQVPRPAIHPTTTHWDKQDAGSTLKGLAREIEFKYLNKR